VTPPGSEIRPEEQDDQTRQAHLHWQQAQRRRWGEAARTPTCDRSPPVTTATG